MAKFDKMAVMVKIGSTGMVPVFYHKDAEVAKDVIKACYDGGVRAFEFTNRGDMAHEVFAECIKFANTYCPELALGVGSVVDAPTAALYIQMGACFVVGPLFNPEIARVCNRRLIPYCPGCGSVSEVGAAQEMGCELTKVFPGDVYGPAMVKNLRTNKIVIRAYAVHTVAFTSGMPRRKFALAAGTCPLRTNLKP